MKRIYRVLTVCILLILFFKVQTVRAKGVKEYYQEIIDTLNGCAKKTADEDKAIWFDHLLDSLTMKDSPNAAYMKNMKEKDMALGTPFFVFNAAKKYQYICVEYPILAKGQMIAQASLYFYGGVWQYSMGEIPEVQSFLKEVDFKKERPIFYVTGTSEYSDVVYMETKEKKIAYEGAERWVGNISVQPEQKAFSELSYEEKVKYIANHIENFGKEDPNVKPYEDTIEIPDLNKEKQEKKEREKREKLEIQKKVIIFGSVEFMAFVVLCLVIYRKKRMLI
ncbi:MAG: hypothetical protein IJ733_07530 [Lachnospiraceae bacterium]|nr:hypothetical protein [Lachnospiraceae bacterium]